MTDTQYERFEVKIENLTKEIGTLSTNVELQNQRLDRIENPELAEIKTRLSYGETSIRALEKRFYAATVVLFVVFSFLQFAAANGWLQYVQNKPTTTKVQNAR